MIKPHLEDEPVEFAHRRHHRGRRLRRRILRSTALLPAMFTVSNGLLGFGAIHFATKVGLGAAPTPGTMFDLSLGAWLLFGAMFCDMIDGRLARMTRRTSDFGAQLDSLSDMISFGVAPAILMLRTVIIAMRTVTVNTSVERVVWCISAVYVACAALRLARFNVENVPDESAHMSFSGLPSPGAAAAVAASVLLLCHYPEWLTQSWWYWTTSFALPALTLAAALLMVSRIRYPHLVNQYIRGKRPFNYLVWLVLMVLAGFFEPFIALAMGAVAYALSGPVRWLVSLTRPKPPAPPAVKAAP
jgi:CDP-diacylglycerol--serine O-phosphatidyltransferase